MVFAIAGAVQAVWLHRADANCLTLPSGSPVSHTYATVAYAVQYYLCLIVIFPVSSSVYTYTIVCLRFPGAEN